MRQNLLFAVLAFPLRLRAPLSPSTPPALQTHLQQFVDTWEELDPTASAFIDAVHLSILLEEMDPPLGVRMEPNARMKLQVGRPATTSAMDRRTY